MEIDTNKDYFTILTSRLRAAKNYAAAVARLRKAKLNMIIKEREVNQKKAVLESIEDGCC